MAAPGAVLTFELSFRANPVALLAWGQARVAMATPCEWSKRRGEHREGRRRLISISIFFNQPSPLLFLPAVTLWLPWLCPPTLGVTLTWQKYAWSVWLFILRTIIRGQDQLSFLESGYFIQKNKSKKRTKKQSTAFSLLQPLATLLIKSRRLQKPIKIWRLCPPVRNLFEIVTSLLDCQKENLPQNWCWRPGGTQ